jgi:hypothetical protein
MGDYSKIKFKSDFLLPKKSFGVGVGSVFNLFGNYFKYNTSKNGAEADRKAFKNDVGVIHQDYMSVINSHNQKKLHKVG